MSEIIPLERIENNILLIRGQKVLLDRDLAELYGVPTKVFNQAIKRNKSRFPTNFMIRLKKEEKEELVTNCDRFNKLKHSTSLPYAFTEHGVAMLSSVSNNERAIQINIMIINTFINMRATLLSLSKTTEGMDEFEGGLGTQEFQTLLLIVQMSDIRKTMKPPKTEKRKIGFHNR